MLGLRRGGRRPHGGDALTFDHLLVEAAKYLGAGGAGWGLKYGSDMLTAGAIEIKACLQLLDECATDAEHSCRAIQAGTPDLAHAISAQTKRSELGIRLARALGETAQYPSVRTALAAFGSTLRHADPSFGATDNQPGIDAIRESQRHLRATIIRCAEGTWKWRLFRNAKDK